VSAYLLQVESVGDVVGGEEGGHQMGDGAGLPAVRTELEGAQAALPGVGMWLRVAISDSCISD